MAFLHLDDPDFWGHVPKEVDAVKRAGGFEGLATSFFLLGKRGDNPPLVAPLRMDPGYVLPRHAHDCYRIEIVVRGSLNVGDRVLKPGSVMVTEPGELYGPHIAGPEGCTTFEICSDFDGSQRLSLEDPSGSIKTYDILQPENAQTVVQETKKEQDALRGIS